MHITEYCPNNQSGVIDLILDIQTNEFDIKISEQQQPDLKNISDFYQHGKGNFWVAIHEDKVVGCISLLDIGNDKLALRKMFVHADFRGKNFAVSSALLTHALNHAISNNIKHIYLGTTKEFIAAHKFYGKNGFRVIAKTDLPDSFPIMKVDSKFFVYSCTAGL